MTPSTVPPVHDEPRREPTFSLLARLAALFLLTPTETEEDEAGDEIAVVMDNFA